MVEDGMWIELSYFQQHQPEGTTLSNKMTVAEAMVVVLIIPFYVFLDDKINYRRFMWAILSMETVSCILAAFLWHISVGDISIMIYVVMFVTAFVGHLNWIVIQPYLTKINNRLAAVISFACNTGSLFTCILGMIQEPGDSDPNFSVRIYFLILLAVLVPSFIAYFTLNRGYLEENPVLRHGDGTVYIYGIPTWWTLIWKYVVIYCYLLVVTWVFQRSYIPYAAISVATDGGDNTETEQYVIIFGYVGVVLGSVVAMFVRKDRDQNKIEGCSDGNIFGLIGVYTSLAALFFWIAGDDSGLWAFEGAGILLIVIVFIMRFIDGFVIPVLLVNIDERFP